MEGVKKGLRTGKEMKITLSFLFFPKSNLWSSCIKQLYVALCHFPFITQVQVMVQN